FFSSRRRHTRFSRDWSSDVCSSDLFAAYTEAVTARLADRVAYWCPVNEPNVHALSGHALGVHAPDERLLFGALAVVHHLLLGHEIGRASCRERGWSQTGAGRVRRKK